MSARRIIWLLVVSSVLCLPHAAHAADFKAEVIRAGKKATALVVLPSGAGFGSCFCIDKAGYFVTNKHVVDAADGSPVKLVLNAGDDDQKVLEAKVVRTDEANDLAILKADSDAELSALKFAAPGELVETQQLIVFGYPFGTALRVREQQFPNVSINVGRITSLRKTGGKLEIIQIDAEVNRGNSGGPMLNEAGEVIGVVTAKINATAVNFAIPVDRVQDLVVRPEISFTPPTVAHANRFQKQAFSLRVVSFQGVARNYDVKLILGDGSDQREIVCERQKDGTYLATAAPLVRRASERLAVEIVFEDGFVRGQMEDAAIQGGKAGTKLSELKRIERRGDRWAILGRSDVEEVVEKFAQKKFDVLVGGKVLDLPWSKMQSLAVLDLESATVVPFAIVASADGKPVATVRGELPIVGQPLHQGTQPAGGEFYTLNGVGRWPAYLAAPPIGAGKEGLKGLGQQQVITTRGDYLTKDFTFELVFSIAKSDGIMLIGIGPGRNAQRGGEPDKSVMFRIHSQDHKGDVMLSRTGAFGGQYVGALPTGTHRAILRKQGDNMTFAIDINNDGLGDDDLQQSVPKFREYAPFLDGNNSFLFFSGGGVYQQAKLK